MNQDSNINQNQVNGTTPNVGVPPVNHTPSSGAPEPPKPMPSDGVSVPPKPMPSDNTVPTPTPMSSESPKEPETAMDTPSIPTANPFEISTNPEEISVVSTEKEKRSGKGFIILIVIFIIFVLNIDNIISLYDKYIVGSTKAVDKKGDSTNNVVHGFIQIDDSESSDTVNNIKFYNFAKTGNNKINLNFISSKNYSSVNDLGIYIELYNSNKVLLYKEQFTRDDEIKKDNAKSHSLTLDNDIYTNSYYAYIKVYTAEEKNSTQKLTCTYNDNNEIGSASYTITYNFINNELVKYSVNKQAIPVDETNTLYTNLYSEYNALPKELNATFNYGTLSYSVDLSSKIEGFSPLYAKGTIINGVKSRELLKKWKCE